MSRADHAYYKRRADEEQAQAEAADTLESRVVHRQLRDLYRIRIGFPVDEADFALYCRE